ncbi:MAG: hypothetical protein Q9167_007985 [Letrouitia subvulpina]
MSLTLGWGAQVSTRQLGARIMAEGEATKDMEMFRPTDHAKKLPPEISSRIHKQIFQGYINELRSRHWTNARCYFGHCRCGKKAHAVFKSYKKPRISSYIFHRVVLRTHIQAFADGDRKEECTHLRNLFVLDVPEPTVEEKKRFKTTLKTLQLEPLQNVSGHQSGMQDKEWPQQLCILSGYLQGSQNADKSDDLVEEDRFSDLESSDGTIEPEEELTDEEDTTEPEEQLTEEEVTTEPEEESEIEWG